MLIFSLLLRCRLLRRAAMPAIFLLIPSDAAFAQLRIVTYNTAQAARSGIDIILESIGEETRNGIAKPIDVLALQEQTSSATTTQAILNDLDDIYGPGIYAWATLDGGTSGAGRPGLIYNTTTVELIDQDAFGSVNTSAQARQTLRYQLRPVGYDSTSDFYLYNSHYKASLDELPPGTNANRRNVEATSIRNNLTYGSDALGEGAHVIYAGDHNFYYFDSREPAWGTLTAAGPGQANDPANRAGNWHNSSFFADVHTQSPCFSGCVGTGGGMDDRFDFQLVTGEFLDDEGLSYISGSYHAFGNGGNLCCNGNINSPSNAVTFPGVTSYTKQQILNALWGVTDHLPVVADYQLPAVLAAVAGSYPETLTVGEEFNLELTVRNAAIVVAANGADELDYSVRTNPEGDVFGSYFSQLAEALDDGNVHLIGFDTSTPGMKSGMIEVASGSQGVANQFVEIPIIFEVLATSLYGDYNQDNVVNAADYSVWRDNLGAEMTLPNEDPSASPGIVMADDYTVWKTHFGETLPGSGGGAGLSHAVPEPSSLALLLCGVCLRLARVGRLKEWTRKS